MRLKNLARITGFLLRYSEPVAFLLSTGEERLVRIKHLLSLVDSYLPL
jgi:hypothetical protein